MQSLLVQHAVTRTVDESEARCSATVLNQRLAELRVERDVAKGQADELAGKLALVRHTTRADLAWLLCVRCPPELAQSMPAC